MTTASFGEPSFAMVENQLDTVQQLGPETTPVPTRRRKVKRKTWQTIIWFVVLLAITAVVLYPLVWLLLLPFRLVGIAVEGALELVWAIITLPARVLRAF